MSDSQTNLGPAVPPVPASHPRDSDFVESRTISSCSERTFDPIPTTGSTLQGNVLPASPPADATRADRLAELGLISPERAAAANRGGVPLSAVLDEALAAGELSRFQRLRIEQGDENSLVLGPYVILEPLGEGGMGVVYRSRHGIMNRLAALKVMQPDLLESRSVRARFLREIQTLGALRHPNLVLAYDAGESEGRLYLAMELLAGSDLKQLVRKIGPFPPAAAVECIVQAARGLGYAHGQGIIHRDVKPGNLFVDEQGTVMVLDLGLRASSTAPARGRIPWIGN